MKKLLPLILSGILSLTASIVLAIDYLMLEPKQLNIRSGYSETITGAMPSNSIQSYTFNANYKDILYITPFTSNGYNNVTLRVYDENGNIIANQFGKASETYLVFEIPSTGKYDFYIVSSSQNIYRYEIKIE